MSSTDIVISATPAAPGRKLGRIKPVTRPRLQFADYLEGTSSAGINSPAPLIVPAQVHRSDRQFHPGMLANGPDPTVTLNSVVAEYGVGCCVPAKILNAIQHMALSTGRTPPAFTGDDSLRLYSKVSPYDITQTRQDGSNPTDMGTEPNRAFAYWQTVGVPLPGGGVDKLAAFLGVDWTRPDEWMRAMYEFDFLLRGEELPLAIEGEVEWDVPPGGELTKEFAPGSLGGHEVIDYSYDSERTAFGTWGEIRLKTRRFDLAYTDQLTACLSEDLLAAKTGVSPLGFNYDRLKADLPNL
jgi:hypothetical protein